MLLVDGNYDIIVISVIFYFLRVLYIYIIKISHYTNDSRNKSENSHLVLAYMINVLHTFNEIKIVFSGILIIEISSFSNNIDAWLNKAWK